MFRGSAATKIDDKGRLKLPSHFRRHVDERYGRELFVTSVAGDSALVYPLEVWEGIEGRLAELPANDPVKKRYLRRISYFGQQGTMDAQGRILMPQILRESAEIEGEVVVTAEIDHLEVWNRERFEAELAEDPFTEEDFRALSERGI